MKTLFSEDDEEKGNNAEDVCTVEGPADAIILNKLYTKDEHREV